MKTTPGRLIRRARAEARLTQVELARRCETAQSAISRLENDTISPTVETLERVLAAAGAELIITTKERDDATTHG